MDKKVGWCGELMGNGGKKNVVGTLYCMDELNIKYELVGEFLC